MIDNTTTSTTRLLQYRLFTTSFYCNYAPSELKSKLKETAAAVAGEQPHAVTVTVTVTVLYTSTIYDIRPRSTSTVYIRDFYIHDIHP